MEEHEENDGKRINRVNYPWELDFRCPACNGKVKFCYSNPKHDYAGFDEDVEEYRYQYTCPNQDCTMHDVLFNPAPLDVLPRKRYSLAVWKWIAKEAKIYGQKPQQIVERLNHEFHVAITESTVRNYINEIDVYIAGKIDANTMAMIQARGKVLLSLDGQEPDGTGPALWLFVDVISNRVLRIAILESADHETLHQHVENMLSDYGVELIGIISDKQGSIVKMHDTFYPDIPHQYCHFHFLQNMWNHVELKDSHVHKELAKVINHLYITAASKELHKRLENGEKKKVRKVFEGVEKDLRKLVKGSSKKFDRLRGIEAFRKVEAYVSDMEQECNKDDASRWVVKIMLKTVAQIREQLDLLRPTMEDCVDLYKRFQDVRALLGNPQLAKAEKIALLDGVFQSTWEEASKNTDISSKDELRTFLPKISSTRDEILLEWVRLYESYRRGLFAYYDFPVDVRSIVDIEKKFGQEKMRLFTQCAKKNVGMQVRIRGPNILKELYAGKDEVKSILTEIDVDLDPEQLKAGLEEIASRTKAETSGWKSNIEGIEAIRRVLRFGKKDNFEGD